MSRKKRNHTAAFKSKVALAAIRERQTQGQITSEYEVHSTQVRRWRDQALEAIQDCFSKKREREQEDQSSLIEQLYTEIGKAQTELNWLKKKSGLND